jgi:hypothetical protein
MFTTTVRFWDISFARSLESQKLFLPVLFLVLFCNSCQKRPLRIYGHLFPIQSSGHTSKVQSKLGLGRDDSVHIIVLESGHIAGLLYHFRSLRSLFFLVFVPKKNMRSRLEYTRWWRRFNLIRVVVVHGRCQDERGSRSPGDLNMFTTTIHLVQRF